VQGVVQQQQQQLLMMVVMMIVLLAAAQQLHRASAAASCGTHSSSSSSSSAWKSPFTCRSLLAGNSTARTAYGTNLQQQQQEHVAAHLACTLLPQHQAESGHSVLPAAALLAAPVLTQQTNGL
jgi:hypothetical protein